MQKLLLAATLLPLGATLQAGQFDPAGFVAQHCSRCHDERVYTRPDRRVQDLQQLDAQVRRCDANFGTRLFDEDIAALVKHLNDNYYKF